jgi:hypothetical protein
MEYNIKKMYAIEVGKKESERFFRLIEKKGYHDLSYRMVTNDRLNHKVEFFETIESANNKIKELKTIKKTWQLRPIEVNCLEFYHFEAEGFADTYGWYRDCSINKVKSTVFKREPFSEADIEDYFRSRFSNPKQLALKLKKQEVEHKKNTIKKFIEETKKIKQRFEYLKEYDSDNEVQEWLK